MAITDMSAKNASFAACVLLAGSVSVHAAAFPDMGAVADGFVPQIVAVGGALFQAFSALGALFVGFGLLRIRDAKDSKGRDIGYEQGVLYLVAGAGLMCVPSIAGVLHSTFGMFAPFLTTFTG